MLHSKVFICLMAIMAFIVLSWTVAVAAPSTVPSTDSILANGIAQEMADETPTPEPTRHPVADKIAVYFDVDYSQIAHLHAPDVGFDVIARAYFLAEELAHQRLTANSC